MHNTVIYIIQKYRMHIDFLEAIYHKKNRRRLSKNFLSLLGFTKENFAQI